MPSLWSSYEEFELFVKPVVRDSRGALNLSLRDVWRDNIRREFEAVDGMVEALGHLRAIGLVAIDPKLRANAFSRNETHRLVIDLIASGEDLLMYNSRLAKSPAAYGFLHQHDLLEHWDRYGDLRCRREVLRLIDDANVLLKGYHDFAQADEGFLLDELTLPAELRGDFQLARDLFSVGFDDVGLLIAGRGLEGVLRRIMASRKITLKVKDRAEPACESDFHDLIEAAYHLRWRESGNRLVSAKLKALLHYLRASRNSDAHGTSEFREAPVRPRETAALVAETASQLWQAAAKTRRRFQSNEIERKWR